MAKSKTLIEKQTKKKTNRELVEIINVAKKNKSWLEIASVISGSRKNWKEANLNELDKESKAGEIIVVPGKVLSQGDLTKKMKVVALAFSEKAKEKLKNSGSEAVLLRDEIKKNPKAKGIKILK